MSASLEVHDVRVLWQQAEEQLRRQIPTGEYNDWFDEVHVQDCLQDCVIVGVPSNYRREYIDKNFRPVLSTVFSGILQRPVDIEIQLSGPLSGQAIERAVPEPAPVVTGTSLHQFDPLNAQYLFENFVIGSSNKMAHAAAEAVARAPAQSYNPLVRVRRRRFGQDAP